MANEHQTYDPALIGGLKLAEWSNKSLALIDEAASIKQLANSCTMDGARPRMLEKGFAASLVELVVNQSAGGQPGNVNLGETYTGVTSGAVGTVIYQTDGGSVSTVWLGNVTGTFEVAEIVTATSGNTASVTSINTNLGGSDNKFDGEVVFGWEAGTGAAGYTAIVDAADGLTALRAKLAALFQGG